MTAYRTIESSLSHDTFVRDHSCRADLEAYIVEALTHPTGYGDWDMVEAVRVSKIDEDEYLVVDNGDDEVIRWEKI